MKKSGRRAPYYLYFIFIVLLFLAFLSFFFMPQSYHFYVFSNARLQNALAEKGYISDILASLQKNVADRRYDSEDIGLNTGGTIKKIELRGQAVSIVPEEDKPFHPDETILTVIEQ